MALLVSIQQAAVNALQAWLASQLGVGFNVYSRWPEATVRFTIPTVTILMAGPRQDDMLEEQSLVSTQVNLNSTTATYTYKARACQQPLQLDVWTSYDVARDDAIARLDNALTAGIAQTLSGAYGDPIRSGVLLPLGNGWTGNVDCYFDAPMVTDTPDAAERSEYRATYRGNAIMDLTVSATSPRMAHILLKEKVHEFGLPAPASFLNDIIDLTAGAVTRSQGT